MLPSKSTEQLICPELPRSYVERKDAENPYNTRVLVHNWYEDRRQYKQECTRCTGHSIYRTDFLPHHAEAYGKEKCVPPKEYDLRSRTSGVGHRLLLDDSIACDYMQNYMTTYDLMYNWELRRAGCKPKPLRRWKMIMDAVWQPQPDNALPFGNLTTIGFRQSPQLPLVPNDWQTYQTDTTYRRHFVPRSYPNDYVLCRYASPKCVRRGTEDMSLVPKPGICDHCRFKVRCDPCACACSCHLDGNAQRFPTLVPQHTLKSYEPVQNLYPAGMPGGGPALKHEPHPTPIRGYPIYDSTVPNSCDNKEICASAHQVLRFQQGPSLPIDSNVC